MTKEEAERFLASGRILRLATVDGKGEPHVVPIWYLYEDGRIYMDTTKTSRKVENIRRNSTVSFCVDVGGSYYDLKNVIGKGSARLVTDPKLAEDKKRKILVKYLGSLDHSVSQYYLSKPDSVVIEVEPKRIISEDYGK